MALVFHQWLSYGLSFYCIIALGWGRSIRFVFNAAARWKEFERIFVSVGLLVVHLRLWRPLCLCTSVSLWLPIKVICFSASSSCCGEVKGRQIDGAYRKRHLLSDVWQGWIAWLMHTGCIQGAQVMWRSPWGRQGSEPLKNFLPQQTPGSR